MRLPSLIGVIHLQPLPGSPGAFGEKANLCLERSGALAVQEAKVLEKAGFDGLILENFCDVPFYKDRVPPETIAAMSVIAAAVRETSKLPIGINILRNDARAAHAVAAVTGCNFIRVNVLSGIAATDQGMVEGEAAFLLRERNRFLSQIGIFADVHVKHAKTLSSDDVVLGVEEVAQRAMADAVILTGATTGRSVDMTELENASRAARENRIPLYVGSGTNIDNLQLIRPLVHGVIVGSAIRKGGVAGRRLDSNRIKNFIKVFRKLSSKKNRKN